MTCHSCTARCCRFRYNANGTSRYRCQTCRKTVSEPRRMIGNRYTSFERTCLMAHLLVEGNSIRSTVRLVGLEDKTVISLLAEIGKGCKQLLRSKIKNFDASHLELDELWAFVYKQQRRVTANDPDTVGDAYTYIALDRASSLVVAWHLGKRDLPQTARFILKVRQAMSRRRFQISSDGWKAYESTNEAGLPDRCDYARIVKVTYPGRIEAVLGDPDLSQPETAYAERFKGTLPQ